MHFLKDYSLTKGMDSSQDPAPNKDRLEEVKEIRIEKINICI